MLTELFVQYLSLLNEAKDLLPPSLAVVESREAIMPRPFLLEPDVLFF